jgi:heme A synthase
MRRFRIYSWLTLGYSLLVILWGYFLRISESGDGCGTDWPLCHGAILPSGAHFPTWVEFVHRTSSGVVLGLVLVLAIAAFRNFEKGHPIRSGAAAALLLTLSESLFGAFLVVFGLVAEDVSTARILIRPFHVTNTFLLMASLGATAWWAQRGTTSLPPLKHPSARRLGLGLLAILALAWTGSWTGLAATAFPAESVSEGIGQYLAPEHLLIYLRMIHPAVAIVATLILLWLASRIRKESALPVARGLATAIGALAGVQLLAGPLTILLLNPPSLRLLHLFLADLLWIGLVFLTLEVLGENHAEKGRGESMQR